MFDIIMTEIESDKKVLSFHRLLLMSERIAEYDKERMLADGSRGRVSVKEKLVEMKARLGKDKVDVQKTLEKSNIEKIKIKEESL